MTSACVLMLVSAAIGQTSQVTHVATYTANLEYPARVASAPGGGIYVTDPPAKMVVQYDVNGAFVNSTPISQGPIGIAVHSDGRLFVSRGDAAVGVYSAGFASMGTLNPAPQTMAAPNDLAFDPVANELYVVDAGADRILVFRETAPPNWTLVRFWGMEGSGLGQHRTPQAIAVDGVLDHVIVTDADNFRVQVFDPNGVVLFRFGYRLLYSPTSEMAWFARTEGVAVDACHNIYLSDALMGTVRVFDRNGKELGTNHTPLITYGTGVGQLRVPCDLLIDNAGKLYAADTNNGAVEVFSIQCTEGSTVASSAGPESDSVFQAPPSDGLPDSEFRKKGAKHHPEFPDNPADIAEAMAAGEYRPDLDLNLDRKVDVKDLRIAVAHFGAGTVEDFLSPAGGITADTFALGNGYDAPHVPDMTNRCGRCHGMDGQPGGMLTAAGQENLCQSCHSAGKIAGSSWVAAGDTELSHPWGVAANQGVSDGPPPGSEMALHLDGNNIRCGTCHNPHTFVDEKNYMREKLYDTITVTLPGSNPPVQKPMTLMDPTLCGQCHTDIADQWLVAGHSHEHADPFIHYDWSLSNRASCRKCHSGFGYIDYSNGAADAQQRGNFRVVDCLVCHAAHGEPQDGELLRNYDTVTVPGNVNLTGVGSSATCMVCHNGRNAVADSGFTPHYLLGGVMLAGVNGITSFRSVNYAVENSRHTELMSDEGFTCATCHMAPSPGAGMPGAGKVGGHTFNLSVHDPLDPDFGFQNVTNACGDCHEGLTTFNRTADGDYDGDGDVEGVQDETEGLLEVVKAAIVSKGAIALESHPYWITAQCSGGTNPGATCTSNSNCQGGGTCQSIITPPSDRPVVEDAIWNWEFVDNSGDRGVKNTGYAVGLLQVAYQGLLGVGVPNAEYRYEPHP